MIWWILLAIYGSLGLHVYVSVLPYLQRRKILILAICLVAWPVAVFDASKKDGKNGKSKDSTTT